MTTPVTAPHDAGLGAVETIVRAEHGRVLAGLIRRFGDIDLAEDALSEALVVALEKWPVGRAASQPRRLADHHRDPQGAGPDPAREGAGTRSTPRPR